MNYFVKGGLIFLSLFVLQSCSSTHKTQSSAANVSMQPAPFIVTEKVSSKAVAPQVINTKNVIPDSVINFARTLIGVKYKYGSTIKSQGFDCSGFINYIFNHYGIRVPRVTVNFTNAGPSVPLQQSKKGDLILFTGTDTTGWIVGHMGMITENENGQVKFIHSSSGNSIGVIISPLSKYYATRFVKVIRVFKDAGD